MATRAQIRAAASALIVQAANRDGVALQGDILGSIPQDIAEEALADAEAALNAAASASGLIMPGDLNG